MNKDNFDMADLELKIRDQLAREHNWAEQERHWGANQEHWKANQDFWKANEKHWNKLFWVAIATVMIANGDKVILLAKAAAGLFSGDGSN